MTAEQNDVRRHVRKLLDKLAQHLAGKRGSAGTTEVKGASRGLLRKPRRVTPHSEAARTRRDVRTCRAGERP